MSPKSFNKRLIIVPRAGDLSAVLIPSEFCYLSRKTGVCLMCTIYMNTNLKLAASATNEYSRDITDKIDMFYGSNKPRTSKRGCPIPGHLSPGEEEGEPERCPKHASSNVAGQKEALWVPAKAWENR